MDLVYHNAHISVGLFTEVLDQKHLDSLLSYEREVASALNLQGRGLRNPKADRQSGAEAAKMGEVFVRIVNDRWYTRAWILQEAFASSGNLLILLKKSKGIKTRHLGLVCHERSPTDEVCLDSQVLHTCLNIASNTAPINDQTERAMQRLEYLVAEPAKKGTHKIVVSPVRPLRTICNAAVALSFLRDRENSVVADRLAIISNLCGYELRLNTAILGKSHRSLAVCVLALALMNGDFSLFAPQVYQAPQEQWDDIKCQY